MAAIRTAAALLSVGHSPKAGILVRASESRCGAATIRCDWHSIGRCSNCGKKGAFPIFGCAIFRSARTELVSIQSNPNVRDRHGRLFARDRRALERLAIRGGA